MDDLVYQTSPRSLLASPEGEGAEEHFISFITPDDKVVGFLRLSLPDKNAPKLGIKDLENSAIIREVHVYGQSLKVGAEKEGAAQHVGLGTRLVKIAEQVANEHDFEKIAVISAVGTRGYYIDRGFTRGEYYLVKEIK